VHAIQTGPLQLTLLVPREDLAELTQALHQLTEANA
jgi:hypothetical protein